MGVLPIGNGEEQDLYPLIGEVSACTRKGEADACTSGWARSGTGRSKTCTLS